MEYVNQIYKKYNDKINIIIIYISEAHAKDEWPLRLEDVNNQHKTIEDRIKIAKTVKCDINIYCDSFEKDNFENTYSSWPERGYIIKNGRIEMISQMEVDYYDDWHFEFETWIRNDLF